VSDTIKKPITGRYWGGKHKKENIRYEV